MVSNYFKKINVLESFLGESSYSYPHPEVAFYCPNCHHRKRKLMINIEKNYYKCWVCGNSFAGRTIVPLIRLYGTQNQLNDWLALTNEVQLNVDLKSIIENSLTSEIMLPKAEFIKLPDECKDNWNNSIFRKYLVSRGITDKLINKYNLKYCDEGQYKNRIIIPSFDINGNVNYFVARNIYKEGLKYLNPKINKSSIVFNELFVDWNSPVIIVEGVFDALKVDYNCVPLLGSSLKSSLLKDRLMENNSTIYLMLDNDAYKTQLDMIETFLSLGLNVYNVILDKKDPGSMNKKQILAKIKDAKQIDENELIRAKLS